MAKKFELLIVLSYEMWNDMRIEMWSIVSWFTVLALVNHLHNTWLYIYVWESCMRMCLCTYVYVRYIVKMHMPACLVIWIVLLHWKMALQRNLIEINEHACIGNKYMYE